MGKSAACIPACSGCRAAPSPVKKPGVDLSACGQLQPACKYGAPELPSPPWELEVAHQWAPTPGFLEVTACLRGQSPGEVPEIPLIPLAMGMMTAPGVTTKSASHVIWDEATGATYLDMVTTSVGRVTLSGPEGKIPMPGPELEDVMDLVWNMIW